MTIAFTPYARTIAVRAVAAAVILAVNAGVFVTLFVIAVVQYRDLTMLKCGPAATGAANHDSQRRLAVLERTLAAQRAAAFGNDGASRYQFASQVKARLARAGVTVLNVLPARDLASGGGGTAFRFWVSGPPSALLVFLRSIRSDPSEVTVNPLRLRVEAGAIQGELTIGYRGHEPENP